MRPGIVKRKQQRMITAAIPLRQIRHRKNRFHFLMAQRFDDTAVRSLHQPMESFQQRRIIQLLPGF
jgi:hypothetical protein